MPLFIVGKLYLLIIVIGGDGGGSDFVDISIIDGFDIAIMIIDGSVRFGDGDSSSGGVDIGVVGLARVLIGVCAAAHVLIGVDVSTHVTIHIDVRVTIRVSVHGVRSNGGSGGIEGITIGVGVDVFVDIGVGIAICVVCFVELCEGYCRT